MRSGHNDNEGRHEGLFPLGEKDRDFGGLVADPDLSTIVEIPAEETAVYDNDAAKDYVGLTVTRRRLAAAFGIMFFALMLILGRSAHVQVVEGDYYEKRAEGNRSRIEWIPSERGIMYDRNGIPLVRNVPTFSVSLTPSDLPLDESDRKHVLFRVAEILEMHPIEIEQLLGEYASYPGTAVPIKEGLSHEQAVLLTIEAARWAAISLDNGMRREYLFSDEIGSFSHLLGYEGRITTEELDRDTGESYIPTDMVGRTGLERWYESDLRGEYGRRRIEVDATGRKKTVIAEEEGSSGKNIVLTIDLNLQQAAEEIMDRHLAKAGKSRGSVIVMRPHTGEILAMVNTPDYDNNLFARGISVDEFARLRDDEDNPMFSRAISAALPSGSTFKLVIGAAAIDEGIITEHTTFMSTGGIAVDKWYFPDWKAGGHGSTDLRKAISESVNTYFYIVGGGFEDREGLGVARIKEYANRFGFGRALGIDLPGEGGGLIPDPEWKEEVKGERWYVGDTYHLAIGQGDILVTPLQVASMTSVFANGGTLMVPRLVNAVTSVDGKRYTIGPEVLQEDVVSDHAVRVVREGMRSAVVSGSAQALSALSVPVAGKTGTAQWSSTHENHAWFTSFAPYDDPEIVVTVVVEEGGEGSVIAAPIARDLMQRYFSEI